MTDPIGVLVMAYGGPDTLEDIEPYLLDVRGGRPLKAGMLEEIRERYRLIGGRSPILERTRAQAEALQRALKAPEGPTFRSFVGMRHWTPRIATAVADMAGAGITRAVGLVMAPHYSRMSIEAYYDKVAQSDGTVDVARIDRWHLLPEFVDAVVTRVTEGLADFPADYRDDITLLFTAHSLPQRILEWQDPYPGELRATVDAVTQRLARIGVRNYHEFAYQSAAMTPDPWLGPDAGEVIRRLNGDDVPGALLVPIGFTSDHVEILYDIDVEYTRLAAQLGFDLRRIEMLNDDPLTMSGLARLVRETAAARQWL